MTDIKSVNAPAIGEAGLKRLYAFARARALKSDSTMFDAGYEQCKTDLRERLEREAILPDQPRTLRQHALVPAEHADVPVGEPVPMPRKRWWR